MEAPHSSPVRRAPLHPALIWLLAVSLLASAWALWWPNDAEAPLGPINPTFARSAVSVPLTQAGPSPSAYVRPQLAAQSAVGSGEPTVLSPPSRDPFNITIAGFESTQAKEAKEPERQEPAPPAPAPPVAPVMSHVVVGRLLSPDGKRLVFLQDGPQTVVAAPGLALTSGYVIEELTAEAIRLRHTLAEQPVSLPLPAHSGP